MTALWAGAEDVHFPNGGSVSVTTGGTNFRSGYGRCAIYAGSGAYSQPFAGGAVTDVWCSARIAASGGAGGTSKQMFGLVNGSLKGLWICSSAASASKFALCKYDGTTLTELAAESGTSWSAAILKLDMQVISYGATATVNVYFNGTLIITYTGNVLVTGVTNLNAFGLFGYLGFQYMSEFIVADSDTRSLSAVTLSPNAAGDANAWTGAYSDINATTLSDASPMYTNTVTQDAQVNLTALPAGTFAILTVNISARAAKSASPTAGSVALGVKSGGTVSPQSSQAAGTTYSTLENLLATNPVTSAAWTSADIAALQLNFRSAA